MNPPADIAEAVRAHAREFPAREVCGLVFVPGGTQGNRVRRCRNVARDPGDHWKIDPLEWERAERQARDNAALTYHSHPATGPEFSDVDRRQADAIGLPALLYCAATDTFHLYLPSDTPDPLRP